MRRERAHTGSTDRRAVGPAEEHVVAAECMDMTPRCIQCGDVIGAYERMVLLADGRARRTSRSSERARELSVGERCPDACYTQAHGRDGYR